ncbi:hypothetical protein D3C72_1097250 [compost metagenome]
MIMGTEYKVYMIFVHNRLECQFHLFRIGCPAGTAVIGCFMIEYDFPLLRRVLQILIQPSRLLCQNIAHILRLVRISFRLLRVHYCDMHISIIVRVHQPFQPIRSVLRKIELHLEVVGLFVHAIGGIILVVPRDRHLWNVPDHAFRSFKPFVPMLIAPLLHDVSVVDHEFGFRVGPIGGVDRFSPFCVVGLLLPSALTIAKD